MADRDNRPDRRRERQKKQDVRFSEVTFIEPSQKAVEAPERRFESGQEFTCETPEIPAERILEPDSEFWRPGYTLSAPRQPVWHSAAGAASEDTAKQDTEPWTERTFSSAQLREIRTGLMNGLSEEQVALYANPAFDYWRMDIIRQGLENGLTVEQVQFYARPEFSLGQMTEIRTGFENGLTPEQVAMFARPEAAQLHMEQVRLGLENGLSEEQVSLYARPEFDLSQVREMRYGLEHGLTAQEVQSYAKPELTWQQMWEKREGIERKRSGERTKQDSSPDRPGRTDSGGGEPGTGAASSHSPAPDSDKDSSSSTSKPDAVLTEPDDRKTQNRQRGRRIIRQVRRGADTAIATVQSAADGAAGSRERAEPTEDAVAAAERLALAGAAVVGETVVAGGILVYRAGKRVIRGKRTSKKKWKAPKGTAKKRKPRKPGRKRVVLRQTGRVIRYGAGSAWRTGRKALSVGQAVTGSRGDTASQDAVDQALDMEKRLAVETVDAGERAVRESYHAVRWGVRQVRKYSPYRTTKKTKAPNPKEAARLAKRMQQAAKRAATTAKAAGKALAKAAQAVAKAAAAVAKAAAEAISELVIATGGLIIPIVLAIGVVAALLGTGFGIFFSSEDTGTGMTVRTAIQEINQEYQDALDAEKAAYTYDKLDSSGSRTAWPEVLSVYAVKTAENPTDPMEVVTMDDAHYNILRDIFWEMHEISSHTETVTEYRIRRSIDPETGRHIIERYEVEITTLYLTVSGKDADEMANQYAFTAEQRESLDTLLSGENQELWAELLYGITGDGGAIVAVALSQVGNVGGQPYWSWYGFGSRVEWCACFVSWCADQCGYISDGSFPKFAGCVTGSNWFKANGQWADGATEPVPGMIIFYDWDNVGSSGPQDGEADHVGIVERVENGYVYTVEGNSGDMVRQNCYAVGYYEILGYGVPAYLTTP